ncbi:Origin recognition complex subunit 3 [Lamellibrachia satsuma]|nr:Origin recognition complex subunit 3 [Lamellibrachia satsuma]
MQPKGGRAGGWAGKKGQYIMVDADGVKRFNNMFHENSMLHTESNNLHMRVKVLQQTVDAITAKNIALLAEQSTAMIATEDYFGDRSASALDRERHAVCSDLWEQINEKIQVLQTDLNTKIFDELLQYVQDAHRGFSLDPADGTPQLAQLPEIPTAALVTGVNMPDHTTMFGSLASLLKERVTPHIAMLRSKDCPTLKTTMAKTLAQLMENQEQLDDDDGDDDVVHVNTRHISCTMSVLTSWYAHVSKRHQSPQKRTSPTKTPKKRPADGSPTKKPSQRKSCLPVVIILEDLECFASSILQDFIAICSNHLNELPIVLVFGIATCISSVHTLLSNSASACLCMEKFQAPPSTEYLTEVINQIVMTSELPFKLGSKVFSLLLDLFLYHDLSVVNFLHNLQFALLDHFYTNPSSILCQSLFYALDQNEALEDDQLDQLRSCLSFRRYVEIKTPEEQIALLEDSKHTKEVFARLLTQLDHYHKCYFPVLRCLHAFTCRLPGYPLGKQLRELYATALASSVNQLPAYQEAINLVRTLSRDELLGILKQCTQLLEGEQLSELKLVAEHLSQSQAKFENIEELSREFSEEQDDTQVAALPKKTDMYTLRQTLQDMEKKKKKLTVYEVLRNETIDYVDSVFRKHLISSQKLPLHEVYYYDKVTDLRHRIDGCPRATIHRGLSSPYHYLQNKDLNVDGGTVSAKLPDICLIYKLHLECGRLINLYDWLQAFIMILNSDKNEEDRGCKRTTPDTVLQARFIRAVSELQFLGFIKPTKRKTDHVARLTWGGC